MHQLELGELRDEPHRLCTTAWKLGPSEAGKESESSGSADILAMIKWEEANGYLPPNSTWLAFSMGWEICTTVDTPETPHRVGHDGKCRSERIMS